MTEFMTHRGPDGAGVFTDGPLGFGHRRLSIIDIDL
jgi:asparagine synthase (glutamine-hydrolysing)